MASLESGYIIGGQQTTKSADSWLFIHDTMATGIRWKKGWMCVFLGVVITLVVFYLLSMSAKAPISDRPLAFTTGLESKQTRHESWFWSHGYTVWPDFTNKPIITKDYFRAKCVKNADYSITALSNITQAWKRSSDKLCLHLHKKFDSIFSVEARKAYLSLPIPFKSKVSRWLGNNKDLMKELYNQDVIHMVSKFTREHTIFNPLRDKRPQIAPDIPEQKYLDDIVNKTAGSCDFCKFKEMTAEHTFGRVESQYAFTASNVFKIDSLHALVAMKNHHNPLTWNQAQFMDTMGLTVSWLKKAKHHNSMAQFPSLIWDVLPKCGASQVHPHIHVMFDPTHYHGHVEAWRQGAQDYQYTFGSNYFTDLVSVYSALGLAVSHGNATAFANLVPRKDHEVVVMANEANEDFFNLLYYTLRAFVDDLHVYCYSMGLGYPALGTSAGKIPAFARIITRGAIADIRADMSSLELFTAGNVNNDPWQTTQLIRDSVQKRAPNR